MGSTLSVDVISKFSTYKYIKINSKSKLVFSKVLNQDRQMKCNYAMQIGDDKK